MSVRRSIQIFYYVYIYFLVQGRIVSPLGFVSVYITPITAFVPPFSPVPFVMTELFHHIFYDGEKKDKVLLFLSPSYIN